MIKVKSAEVELSETTVRELLKTIEETKEHTCFTDKPMPDYDMTREDYNKARMERGSLLITSPYSEIQFRIKLEVTPNTQESIHYRNSV